ncbi:AraC family transcriptional regulator [Thalassotalea atypica]|uniref:AraC family transcriptional regulator n=1 Tax=Thalassotalea atypica TaxID=2054316 RepID=UPI002573BE30|nr:AraC family transcriptional regulator [Thalassotalea atypica]
MISGKVKEQRLNPHVLVENKISFAAQAAELSIYDTFESADKVQLASDQLLFCGMVSGKKIMHADDENYHQEFLPHESFVIAPNKMVEIDFPEAKIEQPTTCLAIEISNERVEKISQQMNVLAPVEGKIGTGSANHPLIHTHHNTETQALLTRMVDIFTENHPDRSFMIDLAVNELLVRLLRHQKYRAVLESTLLRPDQDGFTAALHYLMANLSNEYDIDRLCKVACMSRTKFFELFKKKLGCSPLVYQNQQRLKRSAELIALGKQITQVCFEVGFKNTSHFSRAFKQYFGLSPNQYRKRHYLSVS